MTFVRTKLQLETMTAGQLLEVRLRGAEPLANVPRSVAGGGDAVLSLQPEPHQPADGIHRLVVRKR